MHFNNQAFLEKEKLFYILIIKTFIFGLPLTHLILYLILDVIP